jgi:hypothetical protein
MTLAVGDHLRIQREGVLVEPEDEAYHEYAVVGGMRHGDLINSKDFIDDEDEGEKAVYVDVSLRVIK